MKTFWVTVVAGEQDSSGCSRLVDGLVVLPFKGANTRQIYVAVNGSAFLNIMTTETVHEATWSRNDQRLLQIKNKKIKYYTDIKVCRCYVLSNGTLQILNVVKEDNSMYTVRVYHEDGKLKAEEKTELIVQGEFLLSP